MGASDTAVHETVVHGSPPKCAKMLRDIAFRTHLDFFRRTLLSDSPACEEPIIVPLQPGTRAVRAKPPPEFKLSTVKCGRVFPRRPLGGDNDQRRGDLGRSGVGEKHLGAGRRGCSMTRRPCFEKGSKRCG